MSRAPRSATPPSVSPARRAKSARVTAATRRGAPVQRKPRREKLVYLFTEGNASMKDLLGGKGANLAEMTSLGLPVPPGFIVTTRACNAYLAAGGFPPGLWDDIQAALAKIERAAGRKFGDPANPLLVSCRSGARFSMPGMMDTVLNLGLNDDVATGPRRAARRRPPLRLRRLPAAGADVLDRRPRAARRAVRGSAGAPPCRRRRRQRRRPSRRGAGSDHRRVQGDGEGAHAPAVSHRPAGAAAARRRGGVPVVERQARDRLPQRGRHRARPRHRGQHPDDGLRQPRRGLGHRRRHHAQRHHRRAGDRGRLADQRAGRGRRRRHPRDPADRRAGRRDAGDLARVRAALPAARAPLPRRAGHRVHDRARQAVDAADARRQAHRAGRDPHRRRPRRRAADHPARGGAAGDARPRRLLPAPAVRSGRPARGARRAAT